MDVHNESIEIIKKLQLGNGNFPLYPHDSVFRYSQLSENTFCAYALNIWGEHKQARDFYYYAGRDLITNSDTFTFNNDYQLDGYGTFLWGLAQYLENAQEDILTFEETAVDLQRFLFNSWKEMTRDYASGIKLEVHPMVLACIYGGLQAINKHYPHSEAIEVLENIKAVLKYDYTLNGHFVKIPGKNFMDLKLLFLAYPFNVFSLKDPVMKTTYNEIKSRFVDIHTYIDEASREYNAEWFTLSALLGCCSLLEFDYKYAEEIFGWMEGQANFAGYFQGLIPKDLAYPAVYYETVDRWGQNEKPLLIHHALYLILEHELKKFVKS